jgi:hypothetical protein
MNNKLYKYYRIQSNLVEDMNLDKSVPENIPKWNSDKTEVTLFGFTVKSSTGFLEVSEPNGNGAAFLEPDATAKWVWAQAVEGKICG